MLEEKACIKTCSDLTGVSAFEEPLENVSEQLISFHLHELTDLGAHSLVIHVGILDEDTIA